MQTFYSISTVKWKGRWVRTQKKGVGSPREAVKEKTESRIPRVAERNSSATLYTILQLKKHKDDEMSKMGW